MFFLYDAELLRVIQWWIYFVKCPFVYILSTFKCRNIPNLMKNHLNIIIDQFTKKKTYCWLKWWNAKFVGVFLMHNQINVFFNSKKSYWIFCVLEFKVNRLFSIYTISRTFRKLKEFKGWNISLYVLKIQKELSFSYNTTYIKTYRCSDVWI